MCGAQQLASLSLLPLPVAWVAPPLQSAAAAAVAGPEVFPATIRPELAPDQSKYDPTDPELRDAAALLQKGLNAQTVQEEEACFTQVIERYGTSKEPWAADVVGRAQGNRGNARSRQGRLQEALADYNAAIARCPWSVDPVLNRGVVLEALDRFEEASIDYRTVLAAAPGDPAAWNNLGNASAGMGQWQKAVEYYGTAARLAPEFSFAAANEALARYQVGDTDAAVRSFRTLLRRYPDFDDVRAALAAGLWRLGKEGDAETNWLRVNDPRYKDATWLEQQRRWPPKLRQDLAAFLKLESLSG